MVVALDIDHTITRHPGFFACISQALVKAGHQVVIITFRDDRKVTESDLRTWGIAYTKLVTSTLDAVFQHGVDEWKAAVCRQYGVEVFFEDDPHVLKHVDRSVFSLLAVDCEQHDLEKVARQDSLATRSRAM